MKAIVSRKLQRRSTTYGQQYGGKTDTATPSYMSTEVLENVTSVTIVTLSTVDYYAITHKTGNDVAEHTTNYGISDYNILITGG